jgi:hypothetical protein
MVILVAGLVSGCGASGSTDTGSDTGIHGMTMIGPTCPTQQQGSACQDRGVAAHVVVTDTSDNKVVADLTSADDGSFTVDASAGTYSIVADLSDNVPTPQTKTVSVTVADHAFAKVVITFDSGIR